MYHTITMFCSSEYYGIQQITVVLPFINHCTMGIPWYSLKYIQSTIILWYVNSTYCVNIIISSTLEYHINTIVDYYSITIRYHGEYHHSTMVCESTSSLLSKNYGIAVGYYQCTTTVVAVRFERNNDNGFDNELMCLTTLCLRGVAL